MKRYYVKHSLLLYLYDYDGSYSNTSTRIISRQFSVFPLKVKYNFQFHTKMTVTIFEHIILKILVPSNEHFIYGNVKSTLWN